MTTSSTRDQMASLPMSYQEIMIPTSCAMMIGFASGATTSGKLAGYQFMVENLHRLPQTRSNWFFFQKTKNYKVILGGFKGGLKTGAKLGAWTAGFCTLKEAFTLVPALERRKSLAGALSGFNIALGASLFCTQLVLIAFSSLMEPRSLIYHQFTRPIKTYNISTTVTTRNSHGSLRWLGRGYEISSTGGKPTATGNNLIISSCQALYMGTRSLRS
ncbi:hypothetical protein PtA15_16A133 [Puccinia triticina]|uniref:Mitochondrial import inner membrane translocase subunit TIM22 n=1 Tax=Puccinia triticina TaxID=208348 RepID=A0ABY7D6B8_9BASI|nr:uncharacterized protein PtA15_16A133 [Puccinia triticina]WAQ92227.1 hypothetical protein PtA15_16A133 [Puccinia triticina]